MCVHLFCWPIICYYFNIIFLLSVPDILCHLFRLFQEFNAFVSSDSILFVLAFMTEAKKILLNYKNTQKCKKKILFFIFQAVLLPKKKNLNPFLYIIVFSHRIHYNLLSCGVTEPFLIGSVFRILLKTEFGTGQFLPNFTSTDIPQIVN